MSEYAQSHQVPGHRGVEANNRPRLPFAGETVGIGVFS